MRETPPFGFAQGRELVERLVERQMGVFQQAVEPKEED
jgi:hypothetical protein